MGNILLSGLVEIGSAYLFLILGVSMAVNPQFWLDSIEALRKNRAAMLGLGFWALSYGLLVVITHNKWRWSPSVMITIIGWSALVKYMIYFICPEILWNTYDRIKPFYTAKLMRIYGSVFVLLMLWLVASIRGLI